MPALPPVPKVIKIALPFTVDTDANALVRFFFAYTGSAPTGAEANNLAAAVQTAYASRVNGLAGLSVIQQGCDVEDLSSPTSAIGHSGASTTGTRSGASLPASACLMIQHNIARRYRGGKPKNFWPWGVQTDLQNRQSWNSTFLGQVNTDYPLFMSDIAAAVWAGGGTFAPVAVSYYSGFTVVTNPITHRARNVPNVRGTPLIDPILSDSSEVGIASQRRRNLV